MIICTMNIVILIVLILIVVLVLVIVTHSNANSHSSNTNRTDDNLRVLEYIAAFSVYLGLESLGVPLMLRQFAAFLEANNI